MPRVALSILLALLPCAALSTEPAAPSAPAAQSAEQLRADTEARLTGLDAYVDQALVDWRVPGLSIGIVKDGHVVYTRGFGQRDMEHGLPVTEHTVFPIGSVTKGFTTALLGMLADEGRFDWDTPVRDYLPDFQLMDDYATAHVTTRDMVTHRTGVPRHAHVAYGADLTRPELMQRLRYLEPSGDLRYTWQYNNLMYMAAGHVAEQLTEQNFEDLLRQRLFEPLGMRSAAYLAEFPACNEACTGYWEHPEATGGEVEAYVSFDDWAAMSPCGAACSNVEDMCAYLQFLLSGGLAPDGNRLLSAAQMQQMFTPQMVVHTPPTMLNLPQQSYGLGWFVATYQGRYLVHHGGHMDGFTSQLSLLPAENLGVIVLTNKAFTPLAEALSYYVFDRLLGLPEHDWGTEVRADFADMITMRGEGAAASAGERVTGTSPSHALEDYAGTYAHPAYGSAEVKLEDGVLHFSRNKVTATLEHFHYDTFRIDPLSDGLAGQLVHFLVSADGRVTSLKMQIEPALEPLEWTRSFSMPDDATLARLVGTYEVNPQFIVAVLLQGETLTFRGPTGEMFPLEPAGGLRFSAKDLEGYGLDFSADGQTIRIIMPGEIYTGTKKENTAGSTD